MERTMIACCLLLPLAASCYSFNSAATVRARHAIEAGCPDDQVSVAELDPVPGDTVHRRYRAVGCGRRSTYACTPRSAGSEEWDCRREEEQDPGTIFGTTEGGDRPEVRDSAHEGGVDGGLAPAGAGDGGVDGGPSPVGAGDGGVLDASLPVAAAAPDPQAAVRARIDEHAPDILGCTGRASIGVHAVWDARGVVRFGLPGDLAGRPEESCVQAAIGPLTLATTSAGEVIELVRR